MLSLTFEITEGGAKGPNFKIVLELSKPADARFTFHGRYVFFPPTQPSTFQLKSSFMHPPTHLYKQ